MPLALSRAALCALLTFVSAAPCRANDDILPESQKPTLVEPCQNDGEKLPGCKDGSLARQAQAVEAAFKTTLAKAQPAAAVLLTRDQVWFGEVLELDAQNSSDSDKPTTRIAPALQSRLAWLNDAAAGFGRTTLAGRWGNAFGTAEIVPAADGTLQITLASAAIYGMDDEQQATCKASAALKAAADGWFVGEADLLGDPPTSAQAKPAVIKIRLQGQTLRVIAGDENPRLRADLVCNNANQLTATYFALGKSETGPGAAAFVAPTFDCAKPATAADEEICADPELAANDTRLNRAWKALLPRLDPVTRKLLTADQREWVKTQPQIYLNTLHPARAKHSYFVHWTAAGRDNLAKLQRDRIALLEGFDETRRGFEGDWEAYNAQLSVTSDKDGKLAVYGNKWFEDDYKATCEYDFKGKLVGDTFKPDDTGKNPDSIVRDHVSLIVNPTDDEAAKHRFDKNGVAAKDAEGKCSRSLSNSSTARLFPVKRASERADDR